MLKISEYKQECAQRWAAGEFYEDLGYIQTPNYSGGEWVGYESYMKAQIIRGTPGEVGVLLVEFPADSTEDNRLHTHPVSDRVVTILKGSGDFICKRNGEIVDYPLRPGIRVWMPRGTLHTFKSHSEGMLVSSIHSPFVALEDPKCLCYPTYPTGAQ